MGKWQTLHAIGLWLAGLAIGIKVILVAFSAAPWHMPKSDADGNLIPQIICTGSGFLIFEGEGDGEPEPVNLSFCPLCIAAATVTLANEVPLPIGLLAFAILLAVLMGLDRPRKENPVPSSFSSRAPPLSV